MRLKIASSFILLALLLAACSPATATLTPGVTQSPSPLSTAEMILATPVTQQEFSLTYDELQSQVRFPLLGFSFVPMELQGSGLIRLKVYADGSQTVENTYRALNADAPGARKIIFTQTDLPLEEEDWLRLLAGSSANLRETSVRGFRAYFYRTTTGDANLLWQEEELTYNLRLSGKEWPATVSDDLLLWMGESLQPADDEIYAFEHRAPHTWFSYTSAAFRLSFSVPRGWEQIGDASFSGENGFARMEVFRGFGIRVDQACETEANLHPERYGANPTLKTILQTWNWADERGNPCMILPGEDAPAEAEAALLLPNPGRPDEATFLRLALDPPHAELIAFSLDLPHTAPTGTPSELATVDPASVPAEIEPQVSSLGPLTMESYPIVAASLDHPGHFEFTDRIPPAVLARRAGLRELPGSGTRPTSATSAGRAITLEQHFEVPGRPFAVVKVDGKEAYRYVLMEHAGILPVYGVWNWAGRWVLEVNGALVVEGELYNLKAGLQEIFNFHMIGGKPFFLFTNNGKTGVFYDGKTWPELFDTIFHGACCEAALANPDGNDVMVWFYAKQQEWWHYVELGLLN